MVKFCELHDFSADGSFRVKEGGQEEDANHGLMNSILRIEALKKIIKDWSIVRVPRECNEIADALAKARVGREDQLLVVM
ncbi:hypothetical protein COLO4_28267 [Corchorus olitorius]|uniref:Uncharacterized protein n=1 Tax=Corchorus olitorius TaxID=93759 RepID=A0A1R3HM31_9ROSI|nr:hypothetical protein COLO4_28267 [Corchorus olitorius]